ncbi:MAG TPA: hypothetical protein VE309_15035 [Caulobacteraceae bacterium]|nr:hypothetical protein [Caulobacteraceae bacterium]
MTALRRLIDLPGMADLEHKALMKPAYSRPEDRAEFPEIDALSLELFGITADQAEAVERPADWDGIEDKPVPRQVDAFEAAGWDVTDAKRRPLRMFGQFNQQLWLALRGVAGALPFVPEDDKPEGWVTALEREAARFRKR